MSEEEATIRELQVELMRVTEDRNILQESLRKLVAGNTAMEDMANRLLVGLLTHVSEDCESCSKTISDYWELTHGK